ncbi:hypothetical protein BX600DRAFT_555348 [Xylariales sp. PMI_506]|nr:hypothetical protein BX600DRAFT_555348 [Xylariales sp. PMI_506]
MAKNEGFRAIIVGGGPVGLVAAHTLSRAGIDFILLEARGTVAPSQGATIALNPATLRIFHQLGLYTEACRMSATLARRSSFQGDGKPLSDWYSGGYDCIAQCHGENVRLFNRPDLLRLLYRTIPQDKGSIYTSKKVVSIVSSAEGVKVQCADESVYHGAIVIGADGVHSTTRSAMNSLAARSLPEGAALNHARSYVANYRCMWASVPSLPDRAPGDLDLCHSSSRGCQFWTVNDDAAGVFAYELIEVPTSRLSRYSQSDLDACAERFAEMHITKTLKFKEVWATRQWGGMADIPEGILERWSLERIVLVGDAAHVMTPITGSGGNQGIQDVVVLTNRLRRLLLETPRPDVESLSSTFKEYQESRKESIVGFSNLTAFQMRITVWPRGLAGWLYWALNKISLRIPNFEPFMYRRVGGSLMATEAVLDFLQCDEPFTGDIPWLFPLRKN